MRRLRALPGLRKYVVVTTLPVPVAEVDRSRIAVSCFGDMVSSADAMAIPLGLEMSLIMGEMVLVSKL